MKTSKSFNEVSFTVYKLDSKGKIRQLRIWTDKGYLYQESGLLDGKKTQRKSFRKGKNLGKSNETTPIQQAILEANSKIKKKLRESYHTSIEDAINDKSYKAMLAKSYVSGETELEYPVYIQPKLDGIRGIGGNMECNGDLISRKNKPLENISHILNESLIKKLSDLNIILDGEVYIHGMEWQEINSLLTKYVKGETEKLDYYVYDIIDNDLLFSSRYEKLKKFLEENKLISSKIILVPTYQINDKEELDSKYKLFLEKGYEGAIIRRNSKYEQGKRSYNLLKMKDFIDKSYELYDVVPSDSDPNRGVPIVVIDTSVSISNKSIKLWKRNPDGSIFISKEEGGIKYGYPLCRCNTKLSNKEREEILVNKQNYIGKNSEVRFFEFYKSGIPRFPVYLGSRLDK